MIDELWSEVIAGCGAWADGVRNLARRVVRSYDPDRILRVGMGCVAKALALAGIEPSPFGLDQSLCDLLAINLKSETGQGLEGATDSERRGRYCGLLAEIQQKVLRVWTELA